jgi:translation elongation factor EF-4
VHPLSSGQKKPNLKRKQVHGGDVRRATKEEEMKKRGKKNRNQVNEMQIERKDLL